MTRTARCLAAALAAASLLVLLPESASAQEPAPDSARAPEPVAETAGSPRETAGLRVYLDCPHWLCDFDYLRREIPYVSWVRDRKVADVHVLVTEESTGGGGQRITLDLLGRGDFEGVERRLTYTASPTETDTETRDGLAHVLTLGLVNYLADSETAEDLSVTYEGDVEARRGRRDRARDPWNRWVFEADVGGFFSSQDVSTTYAMNGGLSANRTTQAWKLDFGLNGSYRESRFDVGGGEEFLSIRRGLAFESMAVKSLGPHWGLGGHTGYTHSTRRNQERALRAGPALEYNVFPYSESSRRQLTFLYTLSGTSFDYQEPTVFGETSEIRGRQSLSVSLDVQEPWGEVGASLEGSHFLSDLQQNRLTLSANVELQLVEGLSLDLFGSASRVRDQIYLPASAASDEEVLVGEREFATDFEYFVNFGLSYTFGSIYTNVVNPRFDSLDPGF